jgi:predicted nuclease of predicted toxin-antitoxin system
MKFIADENVARLVIRSLRQQGHDVLGIVDEGLAGTADDGIIALGLAEKRIIITHDKDFGQLLLNPMQEHGGVILLRLRLPTPENAFQAIERALASLTEDKFYGHVVVVEDTRIRVSASWR